MSLKINSVQEILTDIYNAFYFPDVYFLSETVPSSY